MARVLVAGSLGWDVPLWLDRPLASGGRIGARTLPAAGRMESPHAGTGGLPGRLGGGAANIAAALILAGHQPLTAGRVGRDAAGQQVLEALSARGLTLDAVRVDDEPTASAQVLIEPAGERTLLGIGWHGVAREAWTLDTALVKAFAPDAIVLRSGSPLVEGAAPLVIAHLPWRGAVPARVDVAVGSRDDLGEDAWNHPLAAARSAFTRAVWGVITDGAAGARARSSDSVLDAAAHKVPVVDTTGAGDLFIAGLTDALLRGAAMAEALAHACAWGAAAVALDGSAPEQGDRGFRPYGA